ncbi:hypothetical protein [Microbacterium sp. cf046]|uniref:hypothetical protein n=1 Tax=Microbacterium sp. cf046 TaxID=1761803 RepID=UPI000A79FC70|nr:hypothetical protein [Microbacterium sp. cf046]
MTNAPDKRPAFEPASELLRRPEADPNMKRPTSTVAGVTLVFLRVLSGLIVLVIIILNWRATVREIDITVEGAESTPEVAQAVLIAVIVFLVVVLLVDAGLAIFILTGHNWARVLVMTFSAISITGSFIQWWSEGQEISITGSLLTLGLDILILLALSSRSAAAYARRNERREPAPTD